MKLCTVDNCEKKHMARGYCPTHYARVRNTGTTDAVLQRKIPLERHQELFADLSMGTFKLDELGRKYGVTRERIRQLESKWNLIGEERHTRVIQKNREKQIHHKNFGDAFNAVWREAEARGFTVKGWLRISGIVSRKALFINGRRCWVSHIKGITFTDPLKLYPYFRTNASIPGTRIIVCTHPATLKRDFYIFPLNTQRIFEIRTDIPTKYDENKNAWHLLDDQKAAVA